MILCAIGAKLVIAGLFAVAACGQSRSAMLQFTYTEARQECQMIVDAIRTVAVMPAAALVNSQYLAVSGTPDQVAMAEWLFGILDSPPGGAPVEYRAPAGGDDMVRVYYLDGSAQDVQQVMNTVRTMTNIMKGMIYRPANAIVLRGTGAQVALGEWLITGLDQAAGAALKPEPARYKFALAGADETAVRIFYFPEPTTAQRLQEIVDAVRRLARISRMMANDRPRTVTLRGTPEQVEAAEEIIRRN